MSKSRNLTIMGLIAIILLLGLNAFLIYDRYQQDKIILDKENDIQEIQQIHSDLEKKYYEGQSELESLKTDNVELNDIIDKNKTQLADQRKKVLRLISENRDLEKAKDELNNMRSMVSDYISRIERLQAENLMLRDTAQHLRGERLLLTKKIAEERQENDKLLEQRATLTAAKEQLEEEHGYLTGKVTKASVIEAGEIEANGFKYSSNGSEKKKKRAKNIDMVKVCFDAQQNLIADRGLETFYVRIVDPKGVTLAVEDLGSGVIYNDYTEEEIRYTKSIEVDYEQVARTICTNWESEIGFIAGTYQVEIYNKGFLSGKTSFKLN